MNLIDIQTLACGAYGWFQQALVRLCVCAAVALIVVLILRTQTVHDAVVRIAALWRDAAHFTHLAVLTLLSVCVIDAGTKTNSLQLLQMPFTPLATGETPVVQVVITLEEIAQGWRLESVTRSDAVSCATPTNGIEYMSLWRTGEKNWHLPSTVAQGCWSRSLWITRSRTVCSSRRGFTRGIVSSLLPTNFFHPGNRCLGSTSGG